MPDLTPDRLRELLDYDPESGVFTWRCDRNTVRCAGKRAGKFGTKGYRSIRIESKSHLEARLAVLYMTGAWPNGHIDHINRVKADNRWMNLRDVGAATNMRNQVAATTRSRTGFRGVRSSGERFRAQIRVGKRMRYLGVFPTAESANAAYEVERVKLLNESLGATVKAN